MYGALCPFRLGFFFLGSFLLGGLVPDPALGLAFGYQRPVELTNDGLGFQSFAALFYILLSRLGNKRVFVFGWEAGERGWEKNPHDW